MSDTQTQTIDNGQTQHLLPGKIDVFTRPDLGSMGMKQQKMSTKLRSPLEKVDDDYTRRILETLNQKGFQTEGTTPQPKSKTFEVTIKKI